MDRESESTTRHAPEGGTAVEPVTRLLRRLSPGEESDERVWGSERLRTSALAALARRKRIGVSLSFVLWAVLVFWIWRSPTWEPLLLAVAFTATTAVAVGLTLLYDRVRRPIASVDEALAAAEAPLLALVEESR